MFTISTPILSALLGIVLIFSIIELGLSAHLISLSSRAYSYLDVSDYDFHITAPPSIAFLLFCSIWTILVSGLALYIPWHLARRASLGRITPTILTYVTLVLYFVTTVFWLAGFADLAAWLAGFTPGGSIGAAVAFGVLLW